MAKSKRTTFKTRRSEEPVQYLSNTDMIRKIAVETGVKKADVAEILDVYIRLMREHLVKGISIRLPRLGRLESLVRWFRQYDFHGRKSLAPKQKRRVRFLPESTLTKELWQEFQNERERRLSDSILTEHTGTDESSNDSGPTEERVD